MKAFLIRWLVTTCAVMAAAGLISGIHIQGNSIGVLLGASLLLGMINALVRPVLLLLSLPLILITMGLFIFVINALLLMLVSWLIPPFQVDGFWSAFFGSIIISIVSSLLSYFFKTSDGRIRLITHHEKIKRAKARVI